MESYIKHVVCFRIFQTSSFRDIFKEQSRNQLTCVIACVIQNPPGIPVILSEWLQIQVAVVPKPSPQLQIQPVAVVVSLDVAYNGLFWFSKPFPGPSVYGLPV